MGRGISRDTKYTHSTAEIQYMKQHGMDSNNTINITN